MHLLALALMLFGANAASAIVASAVLGPLVFAAVLVITFAAARLLDHRPVVDLGIRADRARALDLGAGIAVGAGSIALVAALERAIGVADYASMPIDGPRVATVAFVAVFFVGVACQEELVFRGYQLLNLTEGLTSARLPAPRAAVLATLCSALAFGAAHAGNEGASILSTVQVSIAGGTLLAVGFLLTGDLAFSVGLHFAWNFTQSILGMPVSGFVLSQGALLTRTPHGSEVLTGGAFGPEASVLGLAAMLVGTAASVLYVRARYGTLSLRLRVATTPPPPPPPSASALPSDGR